MTASTVIFDDEAGVTVIGYDFAGNDGETIHARDLVSMVLGIDADPLVLLEQVETDDGYRRAVLHMVYEPMFQGLYNGRLDAIAAARVVGAKDLCRVIEARRAAEAALAIICATQLQPATLE